MEKQCDTSLFDALKTEAEDLAFEKNARVLAVSLIKKIASSSLLETECMLIGKVLANQLEVPVEAVYRDLRLARTAAMKAAGHKGLTGSLESFLKDDQFCLIADPNVHYVRRLHFFQAYVQWCAVNKVRPEGKHALYEQVKNPVIAMLGVRHGSDWNGHKVIRGVTLLDGEL